MVADFLHPGHLNIINVAASLGEVTVGLLSDKAVATYKRLPFMTYEQRKTIVENIKGVSRVVPQPEKDYEPNVRKYKPDFVVHGTDWNQGPLKIERDRTVAALAEWGGQIVEPEYTEGISSTQLNQHEKSLGIMPQQRISNFRRLVEVKRPVRAMEAYNGLSALVVDTAEHKEPYKPVLSFDAVWLSSLTEFTAKGKPPVDYVDISARMPTLNDVLDGTVKPIIYDDGSGFSPKQFSFTVRRLERMGVCAVVIGDRVDTGNLESEASSDRQFALEDMESFCQKIHQGKTSQMTRDFMVIARVDSLTLGYGLDDALTRAKRYGETGADVIMVNSRRENGEDLLEFCARYAAFENKKYLATAPTHSPALSEDNLTAAGINIVIYADQLLRSAYTAMQDTATSILRARCSCETDKGYISSGELASLIEKS